MFTSYLRWTYPIYAFFAAFLAYEIALLHGIPSPGGWVSFALLVLLLIGLDRLAERKGARTWTRAGLNFAVIFLVFFVNSATTLTRCDKGHHCHRVFFG